MRTYYDEYKEIKDKAMFVGEDQWEKMTESEKAALLKNKTIIIPKGPEYACMKYLIMGNASNLTDQQCAIFADGGNLCFGYRMEGRTIVVYTD